MSPRARGIARAADIDLAGPRGRARLGGGQGCLDRGQARRRTLAGALRPRPADAAPGADPGVLEDRVRRAVGPYGEGRATGQGRRAGLPRSGSGEIRGLLAACRPNSAPSMARRPGRGETAGPGAYSADGQVQPREVGALSVALSALVVAGPPAAAVAEGHRQRPPTEGDAPVAQGQARPGLIDGDRTREAR